MQGTVKFFNETKGFGFIKPSNSNADIFVHTSGLIDRFVKTIRLNMMKKEVKKV